jgi:hypothetical protein
VIAPDVVGGDNVKIQNNVSLYRMYLSRDRGPNGDEAGGDPGMVLQVLDRLGLSDRTQRQPTRSRRD